VIERRRATRYDITSGELAVLPFATSVQILDISLAGALLQSPQLARIGSTGRLTLTLKGQPFSAEIEIRRVEQGAGQGTLHKLGVKFAEISAEHRLMIEDFTQQRND
jgi:c-di-GMP-binding flagellar brake protein YcgR